MNPPVINLLSVMLRVARRGDARLCAGGGGVAGAGVRECGGWGMVRAYVWGGRVKV